ncbi:hypothetical protein Clacol_004839 [Clathrus columnatus]|uniref:Uncharacterized protein n=1 Tax=Clathrus columnatus TaxID=1419009 RepID=A0AAV5AA82_9AGAM|nr:hypothetical protein Clacol_004839 [Clathrus columnatus]
MIIDRPEDSSVGSTGEKSEPFEASSHTSITPYDYPPPSYAPPGYSPPSINPTAGSAGPSSQYQWQPESSSPLVQPTPSGEFLSPNPSSPVAIVRPSSAPPGSNHSLKRDPLNPPPPSFSRPALPRPLLPSFPPLTLNSRGTALDKGFPILLPMPLYPITHPIFGNPYQQQQQNFIHPFHQRDVLEADWTRLLEDIYITAQLSGAQKIVANVLPLATGSLIGSILFTRGIERNLKKKKSEPVADLVDTWNQCFFHARGLHVILAHGPESISGEFDGPAPDWVGANRNLGGSYSSDSSSESESRGRKRRHVIIRDRMGGRREERRARRARRKADRYEHYRLVVVPT